MPRVRPASRRFPRDPTRWLAPLALALSAPWALAVDLGPLQWVRPAGQPPFAEIALDHGATLAAGDVLARVASPEAYRVAGLRYDPALAQVRVDVRKGGSGQVVLRLEGLPRDGAPLDLLLTVRDRLSVTLAEYRVDLSGGATTFAPAPAGTALANAGRPAVVAAASAPAAAPVAPTAPKPTPPAASAPALKLAPTVAAPPAPPAPALSPAPVVKPPTASAASAPTPKLTPAPAQIEPQTPRPAATEADDLAQAGAAVQAWAQAWSRRDVESYLKAYVPGYEPPVTLATHAEWAAQRRERIESRKAIAVELSQLRLFRRGDTVSATFVQHYRGDDLRETQRKQLILVQRDGRWLIQREHQRH